MAGSGGARPGAGRPAGSVSRRSIEVIDQALSQGETPLEYLLNVMRDGETDQKRRDWAAERLAPFIHPRPAPMERNVEIDLPDTSTIEGVEKALDAIIQATATGQVAPAEANTLMGIVEARRKAIETNEVLTRLKALEERAGREPKRGA